MKTYEKPELDLVRFTSEDVICASKPFPAPGPGETPIVPF